MEQARGSALAEEGVGCGDEASGREAGGEGAGEGREDELVGSLRPGKVVVGDCREVLARLPAACVDACVTDPPYHLVSVVKRFGGANAKPAKYGRDGLYARASAGFMGKQWDGGDVAQQPETWAAIGRVLKPGAYLLAFAGTRTYHRMACAIEDAGFVIRDQIGWMYGSGFPKSHNLDGAWKGWGTALKPAWEPICVAQWPLGEKTIAGNVERWGVGGLNIEASRVPGAFRSGWSSSGSKASENLAMSGRNYEREPKPDNENGRWPANVCHDGSPEVMAAMGESSRFFYCAKASKRERAGSRHPTIKPLSLMEWLVGMVTPPGGVVLDPFMGSGSTAIAAERRGLAWAGVELEAESAADAIRRIRFWRGRAA